jgi:hypothetical protein
VADVAIGDGAKFDVVPELGPFGSSAARFELGVIWMRAEDDDAQFAVSFLGVK